MDNPVEAELDPPFEVLEPVECRGPVVFNSPHSGRVYPRAFLSAAKLDLATLRRSEDSFVDELIAGVVPRGHPLVRVHFPRCYVDVNREPYELDPRMFDGRLPSFANTRSMRVAGGLGTVARVVGDAQEIYHQRIPIDDALRRIEGLYKPYHRALRRLLTRVHRDFGAAVLVDCHSMPSTAGTKDDRPRADIVLGDRYGTSCVPIVSEVIEATFRELGYVGQPQQALRGRLHHRALRQSGRRPALDPDRDQPRALHGRAALRALAAFDRLAAHICRWRTGSARSRWRSSSPTGRPPNESALLTSAQDLGDRSAPMARRTSAQVHAKKKGPLASKRPKSREETPKEGGGTRRKSRTALQ